VNLQAGSFLIYTMKRIILTAIVLAISAHCFAQEQLAFPFQGGKQAMAQFFKDSLYVSQDIAQKKATGTACIKFSVNQRGAISKIVVYYADNAILVQPAVDALRKTNHKWVISSNEKIHDFIIPFVFSFNPPDADNGEVQKALYNNYRARAPIQSIDQVPLDMTTLLPPVAINYDMQ
jgi:hypothetical protein